MQKPEQPKEKLRYLFPNDKSVKCLCANTMFRSVKVNSKKQPNDRFIPLRLEMNFDVSNNRKASFDPEDLDTEAEFLNVAKILYNRQNYQNMLREVLLPVDLKVLNFFPPKKFQTVRPAFAENEMWSVKPRIKPVIGPPETVLDMPQFDSHICHHVADWSSNNCLATIFECEVHMWYPDSESLRDVTNTQKMVQYCVKWRSGGVQFAVGLFPNRVGIWDTSTKKLAFQSFCCLPFCDVFCLEWISNHYLITGCSKGVLKVFSPDMKCVKKVSNAHDTSIINIASSCRKTLLATCGMDKIIVIWKIPEMEGYFQIKFHCIVRALAWHPWKNSLLAIGNNHGEAHVVLWNVNTRKQVAREETAYKNSSIDCLTFNPISGELVVSYFVRRERDGGKGSGIITVLSNINKVIEELHIHNGPIPYLLWGSGGRLLASVSADENLCIWQFFGTSKQTHQNLNQKKQTMKSQLESAGTFHTSIR